MKTWLLKTGLKSYEEIKLGKKIIDGRVPDPSKRKKNYKKIKPGDTIVIVPVDKKFERVSGLEELTFKVAYNNHYRFVSDMLEKEGLENVLPGKTLLDGIILYQSFPGYFERTRIYGIYAIGLGERLNNL